MPLPGWLARFNRHVANRVTRPIAGLVPGFAVVAHVGRRTGRPYRTPVNLFRTDGGYVIALTYGRDRDWVRNVVAAGGCSVRVGGRTIRLENPTIVTDRDATPAPRPLRPFLKSIGVRDFLELRQAASPAP